MSVVVCLLLWFVVWRVLFAVCCLRVDVCCVLFDVCCVMRVARC